MLKHRHHKNPEYQEDNIITMINETGEQQQLLEMIIARMPDHKRTRLKSWLKYGHIKVEDKVTSAFNHPVNPGVAVHINIARPFVVFRHPRLKMVYEDDDIIVINKGYGLLSVSTPGGKKKESAYDILREYVKKQNPKNRIFVVHRLDRDTTGLMMFAKNEETMETLRHNWNNMVLERLYIAVLEGYVKDDEGFIKSNLSENSRFLVYSVEDSEPGKLALTRYKVLKRGNGHTLAQFSLDTGRKNQIRVHASEMGHPISGDRKYGGKESVLHRLCLHAETLRFAHPRTRKDMNFRCEVPSGFLKLVRANQSVLKKDDKSSKANSKSTPEK